MSQYLVSMLLETSIAHEFHFTLKELSWVCWKIIVFSIIIDFIIVF